MNIDTQILQLSKNQDIAFDSLPAIYPNVHKLAHLDHLRNKTLRKSTQGYSLLSQKNQEKKTIRKAFTQNLAIQLINYARIHYKGYRMKSGTLLITQLWNIYNCCNEITCIDGHLHHDRCKNRLCTICGAAKTANMIDKYEKEINKIKHPQLVTLTIRNVKDKELENAIKSMTKELSLIIRRLKRKYKRKIKAVRNIEITYNVKKDTYHPHIHIIIESNEIGSEVINQWLQDMPTACYKGQDIREIDKKGIKEVFKYELKIPCKKGIIYKNAILQIIIALQNKRCVQVYGLKAAKPKAGKENENWQEYLTEEIEILKPENYNTEREILLKPKNGIYVYNAYKLNWYNENNEPLINYKCKTHINLKEYDKFNYNKLLSVILKHESPYQQFLKNLEKQIKREQVIIKLAKERQINKFAGLLDKNSNQILCNLDAGAQ